MWKPIIIDGVKTPYDVSSNGEVRNRKTKKLRALSLQNSGYLRVTLSIATNTTRTFTVHKLVANAFVINNSPELNTVVNHIDGNKLNNNYKNLEWTTVLENVKHARLTGLTNDYGENSSNNKYSESDIHRVCHMLEQNKYSLKEISRQSGVPYYIVVAVRCGKIWKHVSINYKIPCVNKQNDYSEHFEFILKLLKQGVDQATIRKNFRPVNIDKHDFYYLVKRIAKKNVIYENVAPYTSDSIMQSSLIAGSST